MIGNFFSFEETAKRSREIAIKVTGLDPDRRGEPSTWPLFQRQQWNAAINAANETSEQIAAVLRNERNP